jgi:hypothetical protein
MIPISHDTLASILGIGLSLGLILYYEIRRQVRDIKRRQNLVLLALLEISDSNGHSLNPETRAEIHKEVRAAIKMGVG